MREREKAPGGTPLYKPCMYVPPQRVMFLRRFGLKTGIDFPYFGLEGFWFSRELRSVWTYLSFQFQMRRKKEKYANLKWILRNLFCACSNLSNEEIQWNLY